MQIAITIGTYKLFDFAKLNVAYCRRVFGDVPILLSDDLSHESDSLRAWAYANGVAYLCSPSRRGHFCADIVALINSVVFAASCGCAFSLKNSQRMIPIASGFREALERAMENPEVMMCVPGSPLQQQIARPASAFYARFGSLTDAVAFRTGAITGQKIRDTYADAFNSAKSRNDGLVEVVVARIANECFPNGHVKLPEWTVHRPMQSKLFLRKSQSTHEEYEKAAAEVGITGFSADLREWLQIERENYLCRPSCV